MEEEQFLPTVGDAPTYYSFNPDTGAFTGTASADLDPGEYSFNRKVVWMLPRNATWVPAPPTASGEVAVYNQSTEQWSVVLQEVFEEMTTPAPPPLTTQQMTLMLAVDADVDSVIFDAIGNRAQEYLTAEQEAKAFAASNYFGDPPPSVASDMAAFERTAADAAQAILDQAAIWRAALASMRERRLLLKSRIRKVGSANDLQPLFSEWRRFIGGIRDHLGLRGIEHDE